MAGARRCRPALWPPRLAFCAAVGSAEIRPSACWTARVRPGVGPGAGVGRCRSQWWIAPSIQPEVAGPCSMATHPGGSGRGLRSRWQMPLQAEVSGKGSGSIPTGRPQANSSATQADQFINNRCNARPARWLALLSNAKVTNEPLDQSRRPIKNEQSMTKGQQHDQQVQKRIGRQTNMPTKIRINSENKINL